MMVGIDDLGLSLSLGFPASGKSGAAAVAPARNLNPMPSHFSLFQTSPWPETFPNSGTFPVLSSVPIRIWGTENCGSESGNLFVCTDPGDSEACQAALKGIDVNRAPAAASDADEDAGVSSPNSTISSMSGSKRSEAEAMMMMMMNPEENERACSRAASDEEDGETSRKKLRLSKDQSAILEDSFKEHNTLNPKQKLALAKRLGLKPRQVEVWFQNRRARTKLKQTEVDCEFLKRCCENLTEENRRLQKEVQELRALKLSPQFYMQMPPPTTLTMCPSCERVAAAAPPSAAAQSRQQQQQLPFGIWAPGRPPVEAHPRKAT
ncbi:hypothetical protein DM860_011796 [Cuscuta australis]|uniref:Homeobox domain-containing protein n=1 Tax=Cuscuta australis TaxID=267555 RepID=A0A328DJM2_9ASTE|nr:hypothetical protein DM860_011796 [Cuscuta australis]